ncbi:dTDP-4-dehydrorhamnose reductase [bacterium BMS3Abin09]|nr:dTDP-4-dehydrorhamnose reductase [bacterium BMS3Abin09]
MKKLLISGASGFLGWNICQEAKGNWEVHGTAFSNPVKVRGANIVRIDLTDLKAFKKVFNDIKPDAVIHTAALTSPNYCQEHPDEAEKMNVDAAVNLAGLCADRNIPFVFTSTDLVFDGFNAPYREDSPVCPVNIYGEQKVRAEEGILKTYPSAAVCRLPLMFGEPTTVASGFFLSMINALKEGDELHLFVDEFRTPVSGQTAARGLMLAVENARGLIHLGGKERISRFNFGLLMMDVLNVSEARLVRCSQKDLKMSAPRAPDLSLDSSRAFALGYKPMPLREQLIDCLKGWL